MRTATEVCPVCSGSGWKPVPGARDGGVTRCDCLLRARGSALIAAARIPKRYEHCELSNFEVEGPHLHLANARLTAGRFVEEYPVDKTGLLLIGNTGLGKTHLAVGIAKALIREKGIECVFYDYADLLKQIQDSYNPTVQATELGLLRPVFETEVLVLDDLGSVRPTEWRWDTVRLILNTRYNDNRTTIITTNYQDITPAALAEKRHKKTQKSADANTESESAAWAKYTLGERLPRETQEDELRVRTQTRSF
jgi:DNA replication protein DnaC